jgi:hypothetical protein
MERAEERAKWGYHCEHESPNYGTLVIWSPHVPAFLLTCIGVYQMHKLSIHLLLENLEAFFSKSGEKHERFFLFLFGALVAVHRKGDKM